MSDNIEILEVEVGENELAPTVKPVRVSESKRNIAEELATAILGRMQDTKTFKLAFMNANLTPKQKLEAIIEFKSAMLQPSLALAMGIPVDTMELKGSFSVIEVLDSIESSILSLIKYEESEIINFSHPKIVNSYRMLFELIVEILREDVKDQYILTNFIDKVSVRCVGLENEFNKAFSNIKSALASMVENPLTKTFKDRDKDKGVLAKRILLDLSLLRNTGYNLKSESAVVAELENLLSTLEDDDV